MCQEEIKTEHILEKSDAPERESNHNSPTSVTGALPLSYRGNYSGMGWFQAFTPDLSDWELPLSIVKQLAHRTRCKFLINNNDVSLQVNNLFIN